MKKTIALIALGVGIGGVALTGCGESLKDAPTGARYDAPMDIIQMADQFSNIGTKCLEMIDGQRMFVSSNDQGSRPLIVEDPNCHATKGG